MPPVENFVRAIEFARAQAGDPYVWGGDGCDGWDCSGFMGGIRNVLYAEQVCDHRTFGTGTISSVYASIGFLAGPGTPTDFTIGVLYPWESQSGIGHTAGTIDGLNVEARGGRGVLVGAEARGADDPLFRHHFHIPLDEELSVSAEANILAAIAKQTTTLRDWARIEADGDVTTPGLAPSRQAILDVATRAEQAATTAADAARAAAAALVGMEGRLIAAIEAIPTGPGGGITKEEAVEAAKTAMREGTGA